MEKFKKHEIQYTDMEDIRKQFIVDEKEFNSKDIERFAKRILQDVKVTKEGKILFEVASMNNGDKIGLIFISRFVANKFEKSIPEEVTLQEVADFCNVSQKVANARVSDVAKTGLIRRIKPGKYMVVPYKIEKFIDKVDKKYRGK